MVSPDRQPEGITDEPPYELVAEALLAGEVTVFLGAGVNVYGRKPSTWEKGGPFLPDGMELAGYLAREFEFAEEAAMDLARVSQFTVLKKTELGLFRELQQIFAGSDEPNALHGFLAGFRKTYVRDREEPYGRPLFPLLVTTNFDDALERAFTEAEEEFDLFLYQTGAHGYGSFVHCAPDGTRQPVRDGSTYGQDLLTERTVILKIHGSANRGGRAAEGSYVITEDHYIEYLAHGNISTLLPATLIAHLKQTHLLFLGYSLRDWNLRAFLHRIWSDRRVEVGTWSIQLAPTEVERMFWSTRGLSIYATALETFVPVLAEHLERNAPPRRPSNGA